MPYSHRLSIVLLLTAAMSFAACGDDSTGPATNNTIRPSGDDGGNGSNNGGLDAGVDAEMDGGADGGDAGIVGESCASPPEELGELQMGQDVSIDRVFRTRPDESKTSCQTPASNAGIYWFTFTVPEVSRLQVQISTALSNSATIEVLRGRCDGTGTSLFCGPFDNFERVLEPDTTYYMVVQGSEDTGNAHFSVQYNLQSAVCAPGPSSCADGTVQYCKASGESQVPRECIGGCLDDTTCSADACADAMAVDLASQSGPQTISGDQVVYYDDWNAEGRDGCSTSGDSAPGGPSPGVDAFLKLSGVQAGDTITFDATNSETSLGFYVLDACDAQACTTAGAWDLDGNNRFEWSAQAGGEFYVVVEALGNTRDRSFEFTVERTAAP